MTDPLEGLRDIHLPELGWPEAMGGVALGVFAALAVRLALRFIATPPLAKRRALLAEIEGLRGLEDGARLMGLAQVLRRVKPGAIPGLDAALYQRNPSLSPDAVERDLAAIISLARL